MCEVENPTRATLSTMGARVEELAAGLDAYCIVIDLADNPGSTTRDYRSFIPTYFGDLTARSAGALKHIAVVFQGNPVLRVASNFIVARISDAPFHLYKTRDEALIAIRGLFGTEA
jgi:hypothetical protein